MFDQELTALTRLQLAQLGREYMLSAQFNSRTGYAALRINHGDESYKDVAIENWMAVSPIYTQRMQRAMGFSGSNDVATIFKGLQLECGFSHQYFDVHFEVSCEDSGRFWLNSCGPLIETEPRGEDAVRTMCHDVEDPTFDATAVATNPKARMRPVHRPPRVPSDRSPHCEWRVFIDHDAEPLREPAVTAEMRQTLLSELSIVRTGDKESGGMEDYSGDLVEQLHLEQLSHSALVLVCKELAIQCHLLTIALFRAVETRYGRAAAEVVASFQLEGAGCVVAERLSRWCDPGLKNIDRLFAVLSVHPVFQPVEYVGLTLKKLDGLSGIIRLENCVAKGERWGYGSTNLLILDNAELMQSIVSGIDPFFVVERLAGEETAWQVSISDKKIMLEDPLSVQIAKGTALYQTKLEDRINLLTLS